jgi:hypothetical protein
MVEVEENAHFRNILPESRQLNPQNFEQSNVRVLDRPIPGLEWVGEQGFDILFQLRFLQR